MNRLNKFLKNLKSFLYSQAGKEFILFPKSKYQLSFKPFLAVQGIITFELILLSLFVFNNIFFPLTLDPSFVIKTSITRNSVSIVAGGTPVKWSTIIKRSDINNSQRFLRLPKNAKNIKISIIPKKEALAIASSKPQILVFTNEGRVKLSKQPSSHVTLLASLEQAVVSAVEVITEQVTLDAKIVDLVKSAPAEEPTGSGDTVPVETTPDQSAPQEEYVKVDYETPAPKILEKETEDGKLVTVSSAIAETPGVAKVSEPAYKDVLAYTTIPEIYKVGQEDKIKIKWKNNGNQGVVFTAFDLNNNGKLDYVEWTVPHLSEQIFEIIFISKAWRLDANKEILEDIYDVVATQDNSYATIQNNEYVRVTFQSVLTNNNDITIYAKPTDPTKPVVIEVYAGEQFVASFDNIDAEKKYKVLLTDLRAPTDVFDLKIVNADVDIDYIVDPVGWLNGWSYRKKITISNTNVDADLTDFPMLVVIAADGDMTTALATGYDIRFTNSGGTTTLKYERETWTGGGGSAVSANIWVKVPTISTAASTNIYMYYGKADATDGQDAVNVWDSNFKGVWHLPDGSTLAALDSTSSGYDGTITNAVATTGKIDGAGSFDGSGDYVIPGGTFSTVADNFTMSAWVNPSASINMVTEANSGIDWVYANMGFVMGPSNGIGIGGAGYAGAGFAVGTNGVEVCEHGSSYAPCPLVWSNTMTAGWNYVSVVYTNQQPALYVNGAVVRTGLVSGSTNVNPGISNVTADPGAIGSYEGYAKPFNGLIDEPRISSVARSAAWVKFEYNNINSAGNEITFGPQVSSRYWVGGTGNWSDTAHWSSTSGGTSGAAVPDANTNVYFDSSSGTGTVTINSASVSVLDLAEDSANITIATSTNGITVTGDLTVNGTISGATAVTLSGSGKMIYGSGTISAPQTISANHTIDATANLTISGTITINNTITITNNGVATVTNMGTGTGTWTQGTNSTLNYLGTSIIPTLTATASGNTVNYKANADQTIKATTYYNLQIGVGATLTASRTYALGGNTTVTNVLTIGSTANAYIATLSPSNYTLTLTGTNSSTGLSGGPVVINQYNSTDTGAFSTSAGTVNYTGDGATTIVGKSYYELDVGNATTQTAGQTYALGGDITVAYVLFFGPSSGTYTQTLDASSYTISLTGGGVNFQNRGKGAFVASTSTVNYKANSNNTIVGLTYYNLQIAVGATLGNVHTYTLGANATVTNVLTIGSTANAYIATLSPSNYTLTLTGTNSSTGLSGGPVVINQYNSTDTGAFSTSAGTVNYTGDGATTIVGKSYYNLQVGNATTQTAGQTYTLGGDTTIYGKLTIGSTSAGNGTQTLDASSYILIIAYTSSYGITKNTYGAFVASTSTVKFVADAGIYITNSVLTFYNLQVGVGTLTAARTYSLPNNTTVTNVLTVGQTANAYVATLSPVNYILNLTGTNASTGLNGGPVVINSYNGTPTGTFSVNGTVDYVGDGATTIAGTNYPNLQVGYASTQTAGRTYTLGGDTTVNGTLRIGMSSGSYVQNLDASSYTITLKSTLQSIFYLNNGGTFTPSTSTVIYTGDAASTVGNVTYYNLQIAVGATLTAARIYTLAGNTTVTNVLTIGQTANAYIATLSGYTLTLTGTDASTGGKPVVINSYAGTDTGTFSSTSGTVNYIGDGATTITGTTYYALQAGNDTTQTGSRTYTLGGDVTINNYLTVGSTTNNNGYIQTLDGSSKTVHLKNLGTTHFVINTYGAFTASTSTFSYERGNGDSQIKDTTYYNLQIGVGATLTAARIYTLAGNTTVTNVLTVGPTSGSYTATLAGGASHYTTTLSGTGTPLVVNAQGVISTTQGTIKYTGATANIVMTPYYRLNLTDDTNNSTDSIFTFNNTGTVTVANLFTLDGIDADDRVNLVSDSPTNQWSLVASGTFAIDYIEVTDSDASGGTQPTYTNAIDGGNNLNWFNTLPVASGISIDSGAATVVLTGGTTKNVVCSGTITDANGYADITSVTAKLYRSGVGAGAGDDNANHYTLTGDANCVPSGGSGNTETYTCTFPVYFYADPTDAGSTYSAENWVCEMTPTDGVGAGTADTDTIEMGSLQSMSVSSTIDFGTVDPGSTSSGDHTVTVTNNGNVAIDYKVSGGSLTCSTRGTIPVASQEYGLSTFSYGTGTDLSASATDVNADLPKPTSGSSSVADNAYWQTAVPAGSEGTCTGTTTFVVQAAL